MQEIKVLMNKQQNIYSTEFCFLNNMLFLLNRNNLPINPGVFSIFTAINGFAYFNPDSPSISGFLGNMEFLFNRFLLSFDVKSNRVQFSSLSTFEKYFEFQNTSESNRVLWVDDFFLPYSEFYNLEHKHRPVILLNIANEHIEIFDGEVRIVSIDYILNHLKDREIRAEVLNFENSFCLVDNNKIHLGLKEIAKSFLFSKHLDQGLAGLRLFQKKILELPIGFDPYKLFYYINRPGGILDSKRLLESGIYESGLVGAEVLSEALLILIEEWIVCGNLFFKLSQSNTLKIIARVENRIDSIIEKELLFHQLLLKSCS